MRKCPHCAAILFNDEGVCTVCGKASGGAEGEAGPAAAIPTAHTEHRGGALRRELSIDSLFAAHSRVVIGRSPACDICLPHPMVSARHAMIERQPGGLRVMPYDSARMVYVGGQRIREPVLIRDRRRFGIGPFLFTLADDHLQYLDSTSGLRLEARGLEKAIPLPGGKKRMLLSGIDLVVEPGEFVSLLGPSGSGKSTLMDCLNGRRRATGGKVIANGEDFYAQYHTFRHSLGYVPQKDIVHAQLTVERALRYTAKLRLPKDIDQTELEARVKEVLGQMELTPHRHTLIGNLSGGQIKRVSLGAELLARPSLLYIDEATSGLDAGTEARMMVLFRQLADDGKSVVCITHNVDNVDRCHLVLVLAVGRLVYCGPPGDAPPYFGVKRLGQIYDRLAEKSVEQWADDFRASPLYDEFITRRLQESQALEESAQTLSGQIAPPPASVAAPVSPPSPAGLADPEPVMEKTVMFRRPTGALPPPVRTTQPARSGPPAPIDKTAGLTQAGAGPKVQAAARHMVTLRSNLYQFRVLTLRYIELLLRDPKSLKLVLLQAPVVGFILAVGLIHLDYVLTMPWNVNLDASQKSMLEYLHDFNIVLAAADNHTVKENKPTLEKMKFTVTLQSGEPQERDGYQLAQDIEHANDVLNTFRRPASTAKVVLGANTPAEGQPSAPQVDLRDLIAMVHAMAKIDKDHPDRPREILEMDQIWPIVPQSQFKLPGGCWSVMFILSVTVFWFGVNNAAKEIVREEAIYARERAAGIAILPYLGSKFLVLSVISSAQALVLMVIVLGALRVFHIPLPVDENGQYIYFLPYIQQFFIFALLSITGIACGLLISACVASPDRATALTPYVLIPQIILGGSFIPIEYVTMVILASVSAPVYWAYRALHHGTSKLPEYYAPSYHSPDYSVIPTYVALGIQLVILMSAAAWFLRRKDIGKA